MNKIDINKLKELQEQGWLKAQFHPTLNLTIWNYTQKTQWESYWNEFTIMCRGLVTDGAGNIVARCLPKFFNYSELAGWNKVPDISHGFKMYEKCDGSYIQLFWYDNKWCISSRGSFTSEHAVYAMDILDDRYNIRIGNNLPSNYPYLNKDCNYIFELIHPDTRIVVDYGDRKDLVLLAVVNRNGNEEDIYDYVDHFSVAEEYEVPHDIEEVSFENLKSTINDAEEGFVIKFGNGERMKIKGEEYVRLHKIVTMTSSRDIWEALKGDKSLDLLMERVPDEWMNWVKQTVGDIYIKYLSIKSEVEDEWIKIINTYGISVELVAQKKLQFGQMYITSIDVGNSIGREVAKSAPTRKELAHFINHCKYSKMLFAKLDGREYDSLIWKMIKPEHEKGFSI